MKNQPLKDIRVLDWGALIATPLATKFLALLGAEVIRVESATRSDLLRLGAFVDNKGGGQFWNKAGRYNNMNINRKNLALDLSKPKGKEIFQQLVKISDVVTENYAPRVQRHLGLMYSDLKKIKPDIIMVSASGWGASGPRRDWISYGWTLAAMSGLAYLTGYPDGDPVNMTMPLADFIAAYYIALATILALEYRRKTGKGQWIDLSQYEGMIMHIGQILTDYSSNGNVQSRRGNRHPSMAPHGVYRCKGNDNWIAIAVSSDKEWQAMCAAMGNPTWAQEERFSHVLGRLQHQDELDHYIETWTSEQDKYEVMKLLQSFDVPAGAVATPKEILLDPHLKERGYFIQIKHPDRPGLEDLDERIYDGLPFRMPGLEGAGVSPPPALGQHNEVILRDLLSLSDAQIKSLEEQGIIGNIPVGIEKIQTYHTAPFDIMLEQGQLRECNANFLEVLGLKKNPSPETERDKE